MTWTKLGDEFGPEARDLTDAEFRTHVEALCWSSWRLLDLEVPKRDLGRFAEAEQPGAAIDGLVAKGWWADRGDCWYVGLRFPEWQRDRSQVEARRTYLAEAKRRSRKHKAGDHSECLPAALCRSTVDATVDPGRDGSGAYAPSRPVDQKPEPKIVSEAEGREAAGRDEGSTHPSPFPTPGNGNGPEQLPPDERNLMNGVQLQSSATAPIAREIADGGPVRASTIARRNALKQLVAARVGASPGCTVHDLQSSIGGNRDNLLTAVRQLLADRVITCDRDPADGRVRRYALASAS